MKKLCIFLIALLPWLNAISQDESTGKGYIFTTSRDSIQGVFKIKSDYSTAVSFKPQNASDYNTYQPNDLISFYINNGSYYKSVNLSGDDSRPDRIFLLCYVEGYATLYHGLGTNVYYIDKQGLDKPIKIEKNDSMVSKTVYQHDVKYIRMLNFLFGDCPAMTGNIDNVTLSPKKLINLTQQYNRCKAPEQKMKSFTSPSKMKFRLGLCFALGRSNVKFVDNELYDYYGNKKFTPKTSFSLGFMLNFTYLSRFSFRPELLIAHKGASFSGDDVSKNVSLSLTTFQIPLNVIYTVPAGKIEPYLGFGVVYGMIIGKNPENPPFEWTNSNDELGYRLNFGLKTHRNKDADFFIEYYYENTLMNRANAYYKFSNRTGEFTVGIIFGK